MEAFSGLKLRSRAGTADYFVRSRTRTRHSQARTEEFILPSWLLRNQPPHQEVRGLQRCGYCGYVTFYRAVDDSFFI